MRRNTSKRSLNRLYDIRLNISLSPCLGGQRIIFELNLVWIKDLLWVEFPPLIIRNWSCRRINGSKDRLIIRKSTLLIIGSHDHWLCWSSDYTICRLLLITWSLDPEIWLYRNWLYDYTDLEITGSKDPEIYNYYILRPRVRYHIAKCLYIVQTG